MKIERQKYPVKFYEECNNYIKQGHSLKETSEKYNINYTTLRLNLVKLGFRTPTRKGKLNPTVNFNEHYFDNIDNHDKAYFVGLLLSDGYICKTPYSWAVGLALQDEDKYILEKLKESMESNCSITHYKNSNKIVFNGSEHLINSLKKLNFSEDKSHTDYNVPNISDEFFNSFVRGYFDGDGCITIKSTGYSVASICCNSELFLNDLKDRLTKFGIPDIRVKCEIGNRKHALYVLYISKKENQQLFKKFIYQNDNLKLIRKFKKFEKIPC